MLPVYTVDKSQLNSTVYTVYSSYTGVSSTHIIDTLYIHNGVTVETVAIGGDNGGQMV